VESAAGYEQVTRKDVLARYAVIMNVSESYGHGGFAQKGSFGMNLLCGPPSNLCVSAFNGHFNAEAAKIRRAPQRKRITFATFCAKPGRAITVRA